MNLRDNAKELASRGRFGDNMLVHMNEAEVAGLASLMPNGKLPTNPDTGMPEAFFFLPFLAGLGGAAAAAPAAMAATSAAIPAMTAGLGALGATLPAMTAPAMAGGLGALGAAAAPAMTAATALPAATTMAAGSAPALTAATSGLAAAAPTAATALPEIAAAAPTAATSALPATTAATALPEMAATAPTAMSAPTAMGVDPIVTGATTAVEPAAIGDLGAAMSEWTVNPGGAGLSPFGTDAMMSPPIEGATAISPDKVAQMVPANSVQSISITPENMSTVLGPQAAGPTSNPTLAGSMNTPTQYTPLSPARPDNLAAGGPQGMGARFYQPTPEMPMGGMETQGGIYMSSPAEAATPVGSSPSTTTYSGQTLQGTAPETVFEPSDWSNVPSGQFPEAPMAPTESGLSGLMGGMDMNQMMQAMMMASMLGGGGGDEEDEEPDISKVKGKSRRRTDPPDDYQPGRDPEWRYFDAPTYRFAQGGAVPPVPPMGGMPPAPPGGLGDIAPQGMGANPMLEQAKGPMPLAASPDQMPTSTGDDQALIEATVKAIKGEVPNGQQIIAMFIQTFGEQALQDLAQRVQSMAPQGGPVAGPGDGMSDSVSASINGQQPAALSSGEYVVPADVVSGLGNGSTDAGAEQLNGMMDRVRQMRHGGIVQPPAINPSKVMPA